nr:hypothetical protein HmN_001017300 [Hymenolepis microstoma]
MKDGRWDLNPPKPTAVDKLRQVSSVSFNIRESSSSSSSLSSSSPKVNSSVTSTALLRWDRPDPEQEVKKRLSSIMSLGRLAQLPPGYTPSQTNISSVASKSAADAAAPVAVTASAVRQAPPLN